MTRVKIKAAVGKARRQLQKRLDDLAVQMASEQKANTLLRLRKGMGLDGQMPPYSELYKAQRRMHKRRTTVRDLRMFGTMLKDMHPVRMGNGRAVLRFRNTVEKQKAIANQRRFRWFGMTKEDRDGLRKYAQSVMSKQRGGLKSGR